MDTEKRIREERKHFPGVKNRAYFLNSSTGLIPDYVYDAVRRYQEDRFYLGGDSVWGDGMDTMSMLLWAREKIGGMLGCPGKNIAFGDNSSRMLNLFIHGIGLKPGDNVILMKNSFVTGRYAWEMKARDGVELRYIRDENGVVKPERIMEAADERTKVIFLCHVESTTGFRHDLARIGAFCRRRGIWLLADAVQSAGILPVDVEKMKIDCLVGNDYKWMMHFCGTGYAYFSDPLLAAMGEQMAGWFSVENRFHTNQSEMRIRKDASRFEFGYPNTPGIYSLALVAQRYVTLGSDALERYVFRLRHLLEAEIRQIPWLEMCYAFPPENRSQIIKLRVKGVSGDYPEYLKQNQIFVNTEMDGSDCILRIGIHYYNDETDIEWLLQILGTERSA